MVITRAGVPSESVMIVVTEHEITVGHLTFPSTFGVDLYKSQFDLTMSEPKCNATVHISINV